MKYEYQTKITHDTQLGTREQELSIVAHVLKERPEAGAAYQYFVDIESIVDEHGDEVDFNMLTQAQLHSIYDSAIQFDKDWRNL